MTYSQKVIMRILRLGSLLFFSFALASVLPDFSQDPNSPAPSSPAPSQDPNSPAASSPAPSQDPNSPRPPAVPDSATVNPAPASNPPANPASFNDVLDRVIQREHLFVAQMRH